MSRLIYVPQYPTKLRYQEWWIEQFYLEFKNHYDEVVILGHNSLYKIQNDKYGSEMFAPINRAVEFETAQINDYMQINIRSDDTLFLADISFPGIFCNVLYHKPCPKMFAFCHATSLNKYDYFQPVRKSKKKIELLHAKMFDCIFFGSNYSLRKTDWTRKDIPTEVVYLPEPPKDLIKPSTNKLRSIDIVSVCRPSIQKVNKRLEKKVERALGIKIYRQENNSWLEYNQLLAQSKIMLISTKEDTFNYTIMDAIRCGCIPLVPNDLCFPEILPAFWRYSDVDNLINKLKLILDQDLKLIPSMICQHQIDNFFENIIEIMKEME